jgi:uncharacterized membrane protein YcfT
MALASFLVTALPPTRPAALASALRQFPGWMITANCAACRILRSRTVETLMCNHSGAVTVGEVVGGVAVRRIGCGWLMG